MIERCIAALVLVPMLAAQTGPGVQQAPYKNDLLDNLVGIWILNGAAGSRTIRGGADAEWVLGHMFLRLHQKDVDGPESVLHIGYDTYDKRLVAIRLDNISARGAETNGYGLQDGNRIQFTFDYPTVPIRDTWTWDPQAKTWQFVAERKDRRNNTWSTVSTVTLRRAQGRRGPFGGAPPQPPGVPSPPAPPQ